MSTTQVEKYIIRTSDRGKFKECRRAWNYGSKIRHNIQPAVTNKNLEFGTAIHAGLEVFYKPDNFNLDIATRTALAVDRFLTINAQQFREHPNPDIPVEAEYHERKELGAGMLRYYGEWAQVEDLRVGMFPIAVEMEFEVPVKVPNDQPRLVFDKVGFTIGRNDQLFYNGAPVVYQGRIDMIAVINGEYWIVDFKTAGRFEETHPHLEVDSQVASYAWAAREFFGYDIAGVIYQQHKKAVPGPPKVLSSGKLSKDKAQNTTAKLYEQSIRELGLDPNDYTEYLEFLRNKEETDSYVRRLEFLRSKMELDNQGQYIYYEAMDMLGQPAIYPNPSYWTCRRCPYQAPCLMANDGQDAVQHMIDSSEYAIGD